MHRLKYDRAVRRWDAPTEIDDGGIAKGCASLGRQWWHGKGMRRPKRAIVAWRWDAPAYIGNGGAARGMRQPKGNGGAARGCAGEKMVMVARRGGTANKYAGRKQGRRGE